MILSCTFEELAALRGAAERALRTPAGAAGVVAPPEGLEDVEALLPLLDGDISVPTLERQQIIERAVGCVLAMLREQMDDLILDRYVGEEDAVNAYFDYANVLTVHQRIVELGAEMSALVELVTGDEPTSESARRITFPD